MIITPDALKALMTGFRKNYQDGLQIAKNEATAQETAYLQNRHLNRHP
ncbi:TPA: hypothetical protein ACFNMH_001981 [Neisseria elongata]|jgi:hypothetical protein